MGNTVFHHVSIFVMDYDRSIRFYKALGFEMFAEWVTEDIRHCFLSIDGKPFLELNETHEKGLIESRFKHFCIHVEDVDAIYQLALDNGASPKIEPHDHPLASAPVVIDQARVSHVYGPDGESIEIINWGSLMEDILGRS